MGARRTDFVTELPLQDAKTVLGFFRQENPSKADLGLAWNNIESYGMGMFLGDPTPPIFGAKPMNQKAAVEFLENMLPNEGGTMSAEPLKGGAFLLFLQFAGPIILKWLLSKQTNASVSPVTTGG